VNAVAAGRSKLVVIADDDPAMRDLFAFALEMDGYRVVAVATGRALVEQVRRIVHEGEHGGVLDLIISDVRMPEMDGVKALQNLRDSQVRVPFILVTAFSDLWTRSAATSYGAELLDKPVELRRLRAVVREKLELEQDP
jgi:DNA-binding response OmpR family regulator